MSGSLPRVWTFVKEFSEAMGKSIEKIPRYSMEALRRLERNF